MKMNEDLYTTIEKLKIFTESFRENNGNYPAIKISILLHMYQHKSCLVQEVADLMKTSRPSAQRHLTSLVVDGMLDREEIYENGKYKNRFTLTAKADQEIADRLKIITTK